MSLACTFARQRGSQAAAPPCFDMLLSLLPLYHLTSSLFTSLDALTSMSADHATRLSRMGFTSSTAWTAGSGATPPLPNECLLLILRQCEGSTLKSARLASKALATIAEPLLWRTLRLVPNTDCLSAINLLLRQTKIACHVQNIIYDAAWEYLIDDFRIQCEKPATKDSLSTTKILQQAIQNQIKAGDDSAEVAYLTRVLLALPNVHELTVKESYSTSRASHSVPHYYRKVAKDALLPLSDIRASGALGHFDTNHSHTRNFLLAAYCMRREVGAIDLRDVSWHTFFRLPTDPTQPPAHDLRMRKDLFSKTKQLDLSFRGTPSRDYEGNLKPLRELLRSCERLESLYLSFTNIINRRYTTDSRAFSYLLPLLGDHVSMRPLMPRLRDLFLNSVFCTQQDLTYFLALHASTLRHVSLSNISLLRHESRETRGCWVKVIKAMKSLLHLETVYFSGWLSNGGRQVWHISEDASDDDRLRPAVVQYITNRGTQDCPLDNAALQPDREDLERPSEGWFEGDWTWTMTYASSKSRGEQTHSGTEMFTKDVSLDNDDWAIANPHFWKSPYKKTYPSYNAPYPSKKSTPSGTHWTWSEPSKKGKQKEPASTATSSAWDWATPPNDSFGVGSTSWAAHPGTIDAIMNGNFSGAYSSTSSHDSASQGSVSSIANDDPFFPEDDIVMDPPELAPPPPPPAPLYTGTYSQSSWSGTGLPAWSYSEDIPPTLPGLSDVTAGLPSLNQQDYGKTPYKNNNWGYSSSWYSTGHPYNNGAPGASSTATAPPYCSGADPQSFSSGLTWKEAKTLAQASSDLSVKPCKQPNQDLGCYKTNSQPQQSSSTAFGYQVPGSPSPAAAKASVSAEDFWVGQSPYGSLAEVENNAKIDKFEAANASSSSW